MSEKLRDTNGIRYFEKQSSMSRDQVYKEDIDSSCLGSEKSDTPIRRLVHDAT